MNQEYKNILVGIDGSEQALAAFKKALEVARRNNGKVYVANVIDQQFYNFMGYAPIDQNLVDQQTETAKQMIEECKEYGKSVDYTNIEGIIAYGSVRESMAVKLPKKICNRSNHGWAVWTKCSRTLYDRKCSQLRHTSFTL